MRDAADTVIYVGKALNLRKRLAAYRVANPDRLPRRHLRLLRSVARIELRECSSETAALATEAALLRSLRPRFNRAGAWPGTPRWLAWRRSGEGLELMVVTAVEPGWNAHGPMGLGAFALRAALARLLWFALHSRLGVGRMPEGWGGRWKGRSLTVPQLQATAADIDEMEAKLRGFFQGNVEEFSDWFRERAGAGGHPFERALQDTDLETLSDFASPDLESEK